jgi:hypothetical protein
MGDTMTQETLSTSTLQETRPPKGPIIHIGFHARRPRPIKKILKYKITEDDVNLVAERVRDHAMDEFEEAENQRGRIRKYFSNIKLVLEMIQAT